MIFRVNLIYNDDAHRGLKKIANLNKSLEFMVKFRAEDFLHAK